MPRKRAKNRTSHTVVLKVETYDKLDRYKVKPMSEKAKSDLTFDDVINDLLSKIE